MPKVALNLRANSRPVNNFFLKSSFYFLLPNAFFQTEIANHDPKMKIVFGRQFALDAPFPKEYFLIVVVIISP